MALYKYFSFPFFLTGVKGPSHYTWIRACPHSATLSTHKSSTCPYSRNTMR